MGIIIWQGIILFGNDIISLFIILIISGLTYGLLDFFGDEKSSFISLTKLNIFTKKKYN